MKILKFFGIVVGIHVFALVLIFANPGCSSSSKPVPAPVDTVAKAEPAPLITVPNTPPGLTVDAPPPPIVFNADAAATPAASGGVRFTPTRPNTPAASTLLAEPVKDVTPMTTYTVKSGDSLWSIANKNKLSYQELALANNLKSNAALQPGQKLIIPGLSLGRSAAPVPAAESANGKSAVAATPKSSGSGMKHTVKSGESLSMIAQKYGVRQRDIAIANNITDPLKLAAGKEIIIPGWDGTTGKGAAKSSGAAPAPKAPVESKPLFATPQLDQPAPVISAQPPTPVSGEVPVIRVDETPEPKKP